MSNADGIKVLIADDEDGVRDVLTSILSREPGVSVVGEASDAEGAIALAVRRRPDVAILDVRMPAGGGPRAASEISRRLPQTYVIALSANEDLDTIVQMLAAGAHQYVSKADDTGTIIDAIHRFRDVSDEEHQTLRRSVDDVVEKTSWRDRRRAREDAIRDVIEHERIRMVFQPVYDIVQGHAVAVEALSRFDGGPERRPDEWFDEAEAVGLQAELELLAIRKAYELLPDLADDIALAVNVSPATCCSEAFAAFLQGASVERLIVEITEHAIVADYVPLHAALRPHRARGLRIAADDIGAGYSTLGHVLALQPDWLKLDASIIRGVDEHDARRSIVRALAGFARDSGADVIAEGIETSRELFGVRDAGVRFAQGFHMSLPLSADQVAGSGSWAERSDCVA